MKLIFTLVLFLFVTNSWALSFERLTLLDEVDVYMTPSDKRMIELSPFKTEIKKRFLDYDRLLVNAKDKATHKKITLVNTFFNKFNYTDDLKRYNKTDYWASKKEFLLYGSGDCEDYAIAKYTTLVALGLKRTHLSLYKTLYKGKSHIVVIYHDNQEKKDYVLDSNSNKILTLVKRSDLKKLVKLV